MILKGGANDVKFSPNLSIPVLDKKYQSVRLAAGFNKR
jgi:hypothetical protein